MVADWWQILLDANPSLRMSVCFVRVLGSVMVSKAFTDAPLRAFARAVDAGGMVPRGLRMQTRL